MPERNRIRNPVEWGVDGFNSGVEAVRGSNRAVRGSEAEEEGAVIKGVRQISIDDLKEVLRKGIDDFGAYRTDVILICLIYPVAGLLLARLMFGYEVLPLLFPLAAGFALLGPVAAVGLYEMSRRREGGGEVAWSDAFGVLRSPAFGAIAVLGLILLAIFIAWLLTASAIYDVTLGPDAPASIGTFLSDILTTGAGWAMILVGTGVGFLFAALVLTISVVSFPMLLDRDVGLGRAVRTSVRTVTTNPKTMAVWGLIVAGGLVLGSIPLLLGLVFVMPVLGHATWHLYRKVVAPR